MRRIRRDVEFTVHSPDGVHWSWLAYLKTAAGEPLQGTVNGTETVAVKLCIAAVDEALAEISARHAQSKSASVVSFVATHGPLLADAPLAARHVLVAEDEAMFRDAAVESLKNSGFHVFQAGDGEQALAILKAHPEISLLVSDVRMPNMDGYALVEQGLALRPNLKVILMTGYAQTPPKVVDAQEIGTLRKPFDIDVLCRRAEDLVRLH
jgi:CheY-like chemotaxis protein